MLNNAEILWKIDKGYYGEIHLYNQFKISKYEVSHIILKSYSIYIVEFLNMLSINSEIQKKLELLKSVSFSHIYGNNFSIEEIFKRLHLCLPNLKKITISYFTNSTIELLKYIRDNKIDITFDIESLYTSQHWILDINKHKLYDYGWPHVFSKVKNNLQFIALKKPNTNYYDFFSFESAIIDLQNSNSPINIINDFWKEMKYIDLSAKNIKILPETENEEIKTIDKFEEVLDLKMFIEEQKSDFEKPEVIFKLCNIYKVRTTIDQPFNSNLSFKLFYRY